jgi:hypothetical protein
VAEYWRPGRHYKFERELSERFAANITLAEVSMPRPGAVRTQLVNVFDPATGKLLGGAMGVQIHQGGAEQRFTISEASADAASLEWLARQTYAWARRLPVGVHGLAIKKLSITRGAKVHSAQPPDAELCVLSDVRVKIQRSGSGDPQLSLTAQASSSAGNALIQLTLAPASSLATDSESLTWTLETARGWIPAEALTSAAPSLAGYGKESCFSGAIQWAWKNSHVQGVARGRLEGVDLAEALPGSSPHVLKGKARIELMELSWDDQRIAKAVGALTAEHARMSRSLVNALTSAQGFKCVQASEGAPLADDPSMIALDLLALRFQLTGEGLTFWGNCPAELGMHEECMAVSGMQPLLLAPRVFDWPHGVLVQTVLGPPTSWVPATREAIEMAGRLPLPLK